MLKYEISGIFSQQMQLRKFPFDVQSLKLQMSSAITEDKLSFCKFPNKPSVVQVQNFGSSNVFELHDMPFILGVGAFVICMLSMSTERQNNNKQNTKR